MTFLYRGENQYRRYHVSAESWGDEQNGEFLIPGPHNKDLQIIASNGEGWEHVSVSMENRCPNWPEMCFAKNLFWDDDDIVLQFHPAKESYVNNHPFCLHMWRPTNQEIPVPDSILVGIRGLELAGTPE